LRRSGMNLERPVVLAQIALRLRGQVLIAEEDDGALRDEQGKFIALDGEFQHDGGTVNTAGFTC
jgi:hypothetical protein